MKPRDFLTLRLDAPLMSFGGVRVDEHNPTVDFPGLSWLTGLLANALGFDHREFDRHESLQDRLRFAVRRDAEGEPLVDFQTVDLGQDFLQKGWTTWHRPQGREGGTASQGTHIRYRHYWAGSIFTLVFDLAMEDESPDLDNCEAALRSPERPIFLGRKCCLPSGPLLLGRTQATSLYEALLRVGPGEGPRYSPGDSRLEYSSWWPIEGEPAPTPERGRKIAVYDRRDWRNQIHTGRRMLWHGIIRQEEMHGGA